MDSHSHEGGAHCGDTIGHVLEKTLLGQCGAAVDDQVQAVEPRSHQLVVAGLGEEIASQLVADKVVVTKVVIEGSDHPVAVGDEVPVEILVHAIGVGKAHQVQPVARHVLAILWTG